MQPRTAGSVALGCGLLAAAPAVAASAPEVMGYLPHWERGAEIRWDVVDTVAYFDVGVARDGSLGDAAGWPGDPDVAALVAEAEREGGRVVLTATKFEAATDDGIAALVTSAEATARFTDEALSLVEAGGGHGLNIDFEFVDADDRDEFTAFVAEVAAGFHAADPDYHVSVAVPALNTGDAYDAAGLLASADALFIMGYDYHYRGGNPGPVAPLASGTLWPVEDFNLEATLDLYTAPVDPADRHRLILGLPLYGYDWPANSGEPLATATGEAESVFYRDWQDGVEPGDLRWDDEAQAPWRVYEDDGGYRQVWAENEQSIQAKLELAADYGVGAGFWALGYAGGDTALWDRVADHTGGAPPPDEGRDAGATVPDAEADADAGAGAGAEVGGAGCHAARGAPVAGGALALIAALLITSRGRRPSSP